MADWLTPEQRRRNMASIRSRGNRTTELAFLAVLRAAGITGWRRHRPLPGRPDFIFPRERVAVFIDGCFWHGCPRCYRLPADNRPYWRAKAARNKKRDRETVRTLRSLGWRTLRLWEHALKNKRARGRLVVRVRRTLGLVHNPGR